MKQKILSSLPEDFPWRKNIHYFDTVDSTNTRAKELASSGACHGTVLIANAQTGGRGRMGRSFESPKGTGIYLSVILRPQCAGEKLMHLTCAVGVAVCDAIESTCGVRPRIKWINDLILGNKKLGGILTELSLDAQGNVDYAVVGIGINVGAVPTGVKEIATSLSDAGLTVERSDLIAALLLRLSQTELSDSAWLSQYRKDCLTLGQDVCIIGSSGVSYGKAVDIDSQGGLLVREPSGNLITVNSGEVSIRGMYGYV